MADTSTVENAIVAMLGSALYSGSRPVVAEANIERGWPTEADIRKATANGMVLVRVVAIRGLSRDNTRYPRSWIQYQPDAPITTTATLTDQTVTFGGTPKEGQFIGIITAGPKFGSWDQDTEAVDADWDNVDEPRVLWDDFGSIMGYAYPIKPDDTLQSIVTNLSQLIPGTVANGTSLALPKGLTTPTARVVIGGTMLMEVGRQAQMFDVATWSPTPQLRDAVMQQIHAQVALNFRLLLPDGTYATMMELQTTGPDDWPSRAGEWRRDLRVDYEYPLTVSQFIPPVTIAILKTPARIYYN